MGSYVSRMLPLAIGICFLLNFKTIAVFIVMSIKSQYSKLLNDIVLVKNKEEFENIKDNVKEFVEKNQDNEELRSSLKNLNQLVKLMGVKINNKRKLQFECNNVLITQDQLKMVVENLSGKTIPNTPF